MITERDHNDAKPWPRYATHCLCVLVLLICSSDRSHPTFLTRTKHIDVRHHFIREHIREKNVRLQYVSTTQMAADILTKALGSVKHNPIKELTGMRQV